MSGYIPFMQHSLRTQTFSKPAISAISATATDRDGSSVATLATLATLAARDFDETERAAIIEYDGGIPREWAEGLARLLSSPPPSGVIPSLWHDRLNRAARFCDIWAAKASACGWSAEDLFGMNPLAPLSRYDSMGAAFFGADSEVIDVTADAVIFEVANGVRQRVGKRPNPQPPVWTMAS